MSINKITPQIAAMYLGNKCDIDTHDGKGPFVGHIYPMDIAQAGATIIPHLRRLSSITDEECRDIFRFRLGREYAFGDRRTSCKNDWWESLDEHFIPRSELALGEPDVWLYLLSRGFDLFGLIDAGLAKEIDNQTKEQ